MEIHLVVQVMEHTDGRTNTTFTLCVHFMPRTHDNSEMDEGNFHGLFVFFPAVCDETWRARVKWKCSSWRFTETVTLVRVHAPPQSRVPVPHWCVVFITTKYFLNVCHISRRCEQFRLYSGRWYVSNECDRLCKWARPTLRYYQGICLKNHEKHQSGSLVYRPRFEQDTFQIQIRSVTAVAYITEQVGLEVTLLDLHSWDSSFESRQGYRLRGFMVFSVPTGKFWESISVRPRPLLSKTFPYQLTL